MQEEFGRDSKEVKSIKIFYKYGLKYVGVSKIEFTNKKNRVDKSWLKLVEIG